jgi:hypothetical protein
MSSTMAPAAPVSLAKVAQVMGFACFLVGAVMLLYGGFATLKSADQMAMAEKNLQYLESKLPQVPPGSQEIFRAAKEFAASTSLLARTNFRVKLALCGVSLLTTAAGGVLLLTGGKLK